MKKFFLIILFSILMLITQQNVKADDVDTPATGDLWDNWNTKSENYREDKNVSDEEFDKVVNQLKEKRNKKEAKKKKKLIPKGEAFNDNNEGSEFQTEVKDNSLPVICVSQELKIGDDVLPIGHYQINVEKENDNLVLKFYQAHYLMAKVNAIETNDDFGEETISFGKIIYENNKAKIIFGSMDYNAYVIIDL